MAKSGNLSDFQCGAPASTKVNPSTLKKAAGAIKNLIKRK